jgi:hypothetical protein
MLMMVYSGLVVHLLMEVFSDVLAHVSWVWEDILTVQN